MFTAGHIMIFLLCLPKWFILLNLLESVTGVLKLQTVQPIALHVLYIHLHVMYTDV